MCSRIIYHLRARSRVHTPLAARTTRTFERTGTRRGRADLRERERESERKRELERVVGLDTHVSAREAQPAGKRTDKNDVFFGDDDALGDDDAIHRYHARGENKRFYDAQSTFSASFEFFYRSTAADCFCVGGVAHRFG